MQYVLCLFFILPRADISRKVPGAPGPSPQPSNNSSSAFSNSRRSGTMFIEPKTNRDRSSRGAKHFVDHKWALARSKTAGCYKHSAPNGTLIRS